MKLPHTVIRPLIVFLIIWTTSSLQAQEQKKNPEYTPEIGQVGKDVIWVPTPDELVEKMLWAAQVSADDFLIDLGSGDGRIVIAAARLGARARGIEYNPDMVELSKKNAEEAGVTEKTEFIQADIFECDLSEASVITMFLLPSLNLRLRPQIFDLKPGTRIVSNSFGMGNWRPDYKAKIDENSTTWNTALIWIVPAKVEGIWQLQYGELIIRQEFQKIFGTYRVHNKTTNISGGMLYGDSISFSINGEKYTGHVTGKNTMEGVVTSGESSREWIATRPGF
jgi:SAM-dependent methyltransferase